MKKGESSAIRFVSGILFVLLISVISSNASATLLGSDTVYISGSDAGEGSFRVEVDYCIYDGSTSGDPLGITNDWQISFVLEHLGGAIGGDPTVLNFGRLTIFAPDIWDTTPFYTYTASIDDGDASTRKPSSMDIDPPTSTPNCAEFFFKTSATSGSLPLFVPGETSEVLVVRTPLDNLAVPKMIELKIDWTSPGTAVEGETFIIIPEPCSLAVFGGTFAIFCLKRRYGKK